MQYHRQLWGRMRYKKGANSIGCESGEYQPCKSPVSLVIFYKYGEAKQTWQRIIFFAEVYSCPVIRVNCINLRNSFSSQHLYICALINVKTQGGRWGQIEVEIWEIWHSLGGRGWGIWLWLPENVKLPWVCPSPTLGLNIDSCITIINLVLIGCMSDLISYIQEKPMSENLFIFERTSWQKLVILIPHKNKNLFCQENQAGSYTCRWVILKLC